MREGGALGARQDFARHDSDISAQLYVSPGAVRAHIAVSSASSGRPLGCRWSSSLPAATPSKSRLRPARRTRAIPADHLEHVHRTRNSLDKHHTRKGGPRFSIGFGGWHERRMSSIEPAYSIAVVDDAADRKRIGLLLRSLAPESFLRDRRLRRPKATVCAIDLRIGCR
jgi:hypothetical protein